MPRLVANHSVVVKRDDPDGKKDKNGNVRQVSVRPRVGEPFDFTDAEAKDVRAHVDYGLREPINETGDQSQAIRDEIEGEAKQAADEAARTRTAGNDAANTARTAAATRSGRKPSKDPEIERNTLLGDAKAAENEDDDEL